MDRKTEKTKGVEQTLSNLAEQWIDAKTKKERDTIEDIMAERQKELQRLYTEPSLGL